MTIPVGQRGGKKWFHLLGLSGRTEELANGWTMKTFEDIIKQLNYTKVVHV